MGFALFNLNPLGSFPAFLRKRQFQRAILILGLGLGFIHVAAQSKTPIARSLMAFAANDPFPFFFLFFLLGLGS